LRAVNVYVIAGPDGLVLVDSGWALDEAREALETGLDTLGFALTDIRRFLVTHMHRDHYTQAVAIRRTFGTQVSLGIGEEPSLRMVSDPHRPPGSFRSTQLRTLGAPDLARILDEEAIKSKDRGKKNWEMPDDWLQDGQQIDVGARSLAVVATPGHTVGHVVFVDDASRLLFAGDHVLPRITPSISLETVVPPNPLGSFLESLALIRAMPDRMLLPAHGPVAASVHARVDELIDHHGRRLDATEKAVAAGRTTGLEVAHVLSWTRREHRLADLDTFNQVLAVGETGSHLTLLVAQGRLRVEEVEGVRHYSLA
jgi:glyoxylase-like metal-dependent hydrolase (beta-lactamase superfamily II)